MRGGGGAVEAGSIFRISPPGIAELNLQEAVGWVGKFLGGKGAQLGIAALGQVRQAQRPLAFVKSVKAADGEVVFGGLGGIGIFIQAGEGGADTGEFEREIAQGGKLDLDGGDGGDLAGAVGARFGDVGKLLDRGKVIAFGGAPGSIECQEHGGLVVGRRGGGSVGLDKSQSLQVDQIDRIKTGEVRQSGKSQRSIASLGGEIGGIGEQDVAGGGIVIGVVGLLEKQGREGDAVGGRFLAKSAM